MAERREDGRDEAARRARPDASRSRLRVVRNEDGDVEGLREGAPPALLKELRNRKFRPQRKLDLHGLRSGEALAELEAFVAEQYERGARDVLVVHGKGLHSEHGIAVLRDTVVAALGDGPLAPYVQAFATAHGSLGGRGALAVRLR